MPHLIDAGDREISHMGFGGRLTHARHANGEAASRLGGAHAICGVLNCNAVFWIYAESTCGGLINIWMGLAAAVGHIFVP